MKMRLRSFALLLFCLLSIDGCRTAVVPPQAPPPGTKPPKPYKVLGQWHQPIASAHGFRERGVASWYGPTFHGKRTANGEIYDMHAMTAAHKILPLGTRVRVTNLENNRQVDLRINDRGPFVRGRVIDLSYRAAQDLGLAGKGTGEVEVVALASGSSGGTAGAANRESSADFTVGLFTFQVGAFVNPDNANRLKDKLSQTYADVHITVHNDGFQTFHRVRVGRYTSLNEIMKAEPELLNNGYPDAFIVAED
jgi:rare lipoprotein A